MPTQHVIFNEKEIRMCQDSRRWDCTASFNVAWLWPDDPGESSIVHLVESLA